MLNFKPAFSLSSFTVIKRLISSPSPFAIKSGIVCIYEVADISPSNLDSNSLAFFKMYSAYKLNKQSDNIQPCRIPFPILN